ncbi:hypothetical protein BN1183_AV_02070 [Pantoea ananatis]|nr:hypothetical protein BN1183_AV_02070 [Pantoea ananatis]
MEGVFVPLSLQSGWFNNPAHYFLADFILAQPPWSHDVCLRDLRIARMQLRLPLMWIALTAY